LKLNLIISTLYLTFFLACSNRPSYVLSEKKMEKVLYDIYLAEAEITSNYAVFSSDSARKQELLNSVLKKHKITEAVLDTSLAWYSGHLDRYFAINENLNKRYAEAEGKLKRQEELSVTATNTNTGNLLLLVNNERFFLKSSDLRNNAYTFKADTLLNRYGGACKLQFDVWGLSASLHPVVTLCVQCRDTVFVKRDTINQNGLFVSSIDIRQGKQIKNLYGSIYFPEVGPGGMTVFIQNFNLSHSFHYLSATQPTK